MEVIFSTFNCDLEEFEQTTESRIVVFLYTFNCDLEESERNTESHIFHF